MNHNRCSRRAFLRSGLATAALAPFAGSLNPLAFAADSPARGPQTGKVAIVSCKTYGPAVRQAYDEAFDLLGGLGSLVRGKTCTIKLNLTGTNFTNFKDRPVGETYMTHFDTAAALTAALFKAGAARVRFVESNQSRAKLESTLSLADWDVNALNAMGKVEYENTRNLGSGKKYSHFKVPDGGRMFSSLELNHTYEGTDVMISLCKLKQHLTAGVTLSMKNLFGLTPIHSTATKPAAKMPPPVADPFTARSVSKTATSSCRASRKETFPSNPPGACLAPSSISAPPARFTWRSSMASLQ